MLKNEKQQRIMIAFIFYVIAIGLAVAECIILGFIPSFSDLILVPIPYFIYYILISKAVDENSIIPLIGIIVVAVFVGVPSAENQNLICEIAEVILFIVQIITAFVIKFIRERIKN